MASLSETDWKNVLNNPKNLGLKVGGTGISNLLRLVHESGKAAKGNPCMKFVVIYSDHLHKLSAQCKSVAEKHGKLFTTACAYLVEIKKLADSEINTVKKKLEAAAKQKVLSGKDHVDINGTHLATIN